MIWTHKFAHHKELKSALLKSIEHSKGKEYVKSGDQITKTDYYEKLDLSEKHYLTLFHSNLTEFYKELHERYALGDFFLYNGWYQQYYESDTHGWHAHGLSNISMVYYLEMPEPHVTEFWIPHVKERYTPKAQEGDIVVFPAHFPHRSPPIKGEVRKTIISVNYNIHNIDSKFIEDGK